MAGKRKNQVYRKRKKKKKGNIKNQPKKRLNKNQKKIKRGGYTKKEKKAVDLSQEKRIKVIETKLKDVHTLYNIRNPGYNNWVNTATQALIPTWIDMAQNMNVQECYDSWDVTPQIHLPSYNRDIVTGAVTANVYKPVPGVGTYQVPLGGQNAMNIPLNFNRIHITKFKCIFNYRQWVHDVVNTTGDFPIFTLQQEYIKNSGIFKVRLYLISQPVKTETPDNKIANIARQLPGPFQTKKAATLRVKEGYSNANNQTSNLVEKLKYIIHYDEIITPKFQLQYQVERQVNNTGGTLDIIPYSRSYMISILRSPEIILNKDLEFSTTYDVRVNNTPNNLTFHWVMKFADIEQSKMINDQIIASTSSQQVQYKNKFNIYKKS